MNAVIHSQVLSECDKKTDPPQGDHAILAIISRVATDPQCDIEKMQQLLQMHERIQARQATTQFAADLAAMQTALPSISERGDASGRYKYALWEDVNTTIKPILSQFGFALSFRTDFSNGIAVTAVLTHKGGHSESTTIQLPADLSGNKNAVQAVASSISYGKRYTAAALLNITSHGEDDDAYTAGEPDDVRHWRSVLANAKTEADLKELADQIKNDKTIPSHRVSTIRSLWRMKRDELHGAQEAGAAA